MKSLGKIVEAQNCTNSNRSLYGRCNRGNILPQVPTSSTNSASIKIKNFQIRNIRMMSLTIILITCIFIILTLPIMLYIILIKLGSTKSETIEKKDIFDDPNCQSILWALVNIFMYTNHSINFVLYCLTGSKFRTELATLFLPKKVTLSAYKFFNNNNNHHHQSNFNNNVLSTFEQSTCLPPAHSCSMRHNNTFYGNASNYARNFESVVDLKNDNNNCYQNYLAPNAIRAQNIYSNRKKRLNLKAEVSI